MIIAVWLGSNLH